MMSGFSSFEVGAVSVATTENMGHDPDFWAEQATKRIVSIGGNCHPIIAQQAKVFRDAVLEQISYYMKEAIKSDRTTLIAELEKQGQQEMANIIRRL
tara:strand:+ start:252 stop:542 length:291 start_codon:yes stop_codon:yes gene_type:complete